MRRAVLVLVVLAVAACGEEGASDCEGSGADAVEWGGDLYRGHAQAPSRLRPGPPVEGGFRRLCGGVTKPVRLREIRGVPIEVALFPAGDTDRFYRNAGFLLELPEHPLHDDFYGGPGRPRRRARGEACMLDGEVVALGYLHVRIGGRDVAVAVDARTRISGFERAGLPYLREGDQVRVLARGCGDDHVLARRIDPRP
jgi:hypothetical protein